MLPVVRRRRLPARLDGWRFDGIENRRPRRRAADRRHGPERPAGPPRGGLQRRAARLRGPAEAQHAARRVEPSPGQEPRGGRLALRAPFPLRFL